MTKGSTTHRTGLVLAVAVGLLVGWQLSRTDTFGQQPGLALRGIAAVLMSVIYGAAFREVVTTQNPWVRWPVSALFLLLTLGTAYDALIL